MWFRLAILVALLIAPSSGWAQIKTKATIQSEIITSLPDQNAGVITPAIMRGILSDLLNSYLQGSKVNAQSAASYTMQCTDMGALVTFSNAGLVAVSLPAASAACFNSNWTATLKDIGSGTVTITPQSGLINGAASLVLTANQVATIISDGANWQTGGMTPPLATATVNYNPTLAAMFGAL